MTNKKMTKRDYFTAILAKYDLTAEEKAFIEHELELLNKKNASEKKPTAQQIENDNLRDVIVNTLRDSGVMMTITELQKSCPELSELTNQRISALIRPLLNVSIERIEDKRKAYFKAM